MKVKNDFVTNSSSSSFIILKSNLTENQISKIYDHRSSCDDDWDVWSIYEDDDKIEGFTTMDNFDMGFYLSEIGIPDRFITWRD